ncbi:hypothetical protein FRB90_000887 [Tulasnella sp. 427]|nr:hypothetical protein FRB90_000887 [Tulasnella sp. 427]
MNDPDATLAPAPAPPPTKAANHNRRRSVFRSIRMSMSVSSSTAATTNSNNVDLSSTPPPLPQPPALPVSSAIVSGSPSQGPPPPLPTRLPPQQHPLPPATSSENGSISSHRTPSPAGGPLILPTQSSSSSFGNKLGLRRLLKSSTNKGSGAQTDYECDDVGMLPSQTQAQQHQFPSSKPPPLPSSSESPGVRGGWQTDVEGPSRSNGKSSNGKVALPPRLRIESKIHAFTAGLRRHHAMMSNPPQQSQSPLSPSRPAPPPKPFDLRSPTSPKPSAGAGLRPPPPHGVVDDRDEEDKVDDPRPTTPRSFESSSRSGGGPNRPLTPTMIAAQNVAAASALMPSKVTQLAARVAGAASSSESRGSMLLIPPSGVEGGAGGPGGGRVPRTSFQMPNSPSISAALSYMQTVGSNDDEKEEKSAGSGGGGGGSLKKREKRRSAAPAVTSTAAASGGLRPVPEGSAAAHYTNTNSNQATTGAGVLNSPPPRVDSLLKSGPRTNLVNTPQRGMKRRSASLGDVFAGVTPGASQAFSASSSAPGGASALGGGGAEQNGFVKRPVHGRSNSSGNNGTLGANSVAATYQYINAELQDDGQPSAFLQRPQASSSNHGQHHHQQQAHNNSLSPTPATTSVAVPSSTSSGAVKAIIAPPLPARKKPASVERTNENGGGYGSAGESSSTEFGGSSKGSGSVLKNNIKGRLAAWTAANASSSSAGQSTRQGGAAGRSPPSSYALGSPSSAATASSPSDLSAGSSPYSRGRSHSHALLSNSPPVPATPNPKRMTATMMGGGNVRLTPQHPSQTSLHSTNSNSGTGSGPTASYVANVAVNTAGSIGAAAGGMAMQLGRKVGNFLGHRGGAGASSQSGNWGGLAGYVTAGEESFGGFHQGGGGGRGGSRERESHDGGTGAMSDSGSYQGGHHVNRKMLGTMVRAPLRKGKGAVFGRPLRECVKETRVSADEEGGGEPQRGNGVWVTALVTRCIEHLTQWGLEEEGLFRITGRATHVARIRNEFDTGADYLLKEAHPSDLDPHAVSSIFKAYLRELPEPILTKDLAPQFDLAMLLGTGEEATPGTRVTAFGGGFSGLGDNSSFDAPTTEAMAELKNLMARLPRENYDLLYEICKLLRSTARCSKATKMPLSNLLLVFCPSLQLSPGFLKVMIEKQDYLFGNGDVGPVSPSRNVETDKPKSGSAVRGPPLPQRPGPDDSKRNRTASILLPQGFAFTVEAYPESISTDPVPQTQPQSQSQVPPSRPITPNGYNTIGQPPGSPSSISSHSMHRVQLPPNFGQGGSARVRQPSSAKRQPSLASLFTGGGNKSTPTISSPIPIVTRSETPSEPPKLDVDLPTGSLTVGGDFGTLNERQLTPTTPPTATSSQSPFTSDSENFKLTSTVPAKEINVVPRPSATPVGIAHSPPPQIPVLRAPPRASGDDWATSVLMAAGGAK